MVISRRNKTVIAVAATFVILVAAILSVFLLCRKENPDDPAGTDTAGGGSAGVTDTEATKHTDKPETDTGTFSPETFPDTSHMGNTPETYAPSPVLDGKNIPPAPGGYFSDTLFIGDSRAAGIREYGGIEADADFFASKGLNIYHVWKETLPFAGGECTLGDVLAKRQYSKIYVILGINELGYDMARTVEKYSAMINDIAAAQPGAKIYVCANLHVTAERSATDNIYNNCKINEFNKGISAAAVGENRVYLDVNTLFDDASGALRTDCASDSAHVLGRYYALWRDWLYNMSK